MPAAGLTGARESSAGDEFHIRWAVRRIIGLLDPSSTLEQVVIEDLEAVPSAGLPEELLLGVDMAEFFGGTSLATADRVVVSQLKYSTRHPNTAWTAARLAPASDPGHKSVIRRLADIYVAIAGASDRLTVRGRFTIQLVSNQPCDSGLERTLASAKSWLQQRPGRCRSADLLAALSSQRGRSGLKRIWEVSGLGSYDFTEFVRVLTLDNLGELGLAAQELAITASLGEHVLEEPEAASLQLQKLVRDYALPEARGEAITRAEVLAKLGVFGEEDLLPAPSRLQAPEHAVPTSDSRTILEALDAATDSRLLVHGDAGVGKTTAVMALREALPAGSEIVTFDCFGGGDYLNAGEARHTERRFCLQVCNQLAVQCRLPILIKPPDDDEDLWRALSRRIARVARLLSEQGSRLLVVVDAADNSSWAAQTVGEDSFLGPLWRLRIPAGAGLIVTCRSHRRGNLLAPDGLAQVRLNGFDEAESAAHLRTRFPDATDLDARQFHEGNNGNPRVQTYALGTADGQTDGQLAKVIDRAQRLPQSIFEDLYTAAVQHVPETSSPREKLAELVCLTKPVSGARFAAVSGLAAGIVREFCRGLEPGVTVEDDRIAFRDEDFARYLLEKIGDDELRSAHSRLADQFLAQPDDPAAAIAVAEHLHNSGRGSDLLRLALDEPPPPAVADPLLRQQTYRRRLFLALRHASRPEERLAACKLIVLYAEAARHNLAVRRLLRDRPDLGMRYGDPEAVARIYAEETDPEWLGSLHMKLAGVYALGGDRSAATTHYDQAWAWLRRRFREDEHWPIEARDLASLAVAPACLGGPKDAAREANRWSPATFREQIWEGLITQLVHASRDVNGLINIDDVPQDVRARRFAAAYQAGAKFEAPDVVALIGPMTSHPPEVSKDDGRWIAGFVELVGSVCPDRGRVIDLCDALALPPAGRAPDRFSWLRDFNDLLRVAAVRAVCEGKSIDLERLMPTSVTKPADDPREQSRAQEERRLVETRVGRFLPVYEARARAIMSSPPVSVLASARAELMGKRGATGVYSDETDYGHRRWLAAFTDAVLASTGTDPELVRAAATEVPSGDRLQCWLTIARKLVTDARYRTEGLLLLEKVATFIEEAEVPASEKTEVLLDACAIADPVDRVQAQDLHDRAVTAAESIDDDGAVRLRLHACVAASLEPDRERRQMLVRLAAAVPTYVLRVTDDRLLPWVETIKAIAEIDPQLAAVLICRWEDSGVMFLDESVNACAVPLANRGLLSPQDGLALLTLAGEERGAMSTTTTLLEQIPAGPARAAALNQVCERVGRDLLGRARSGAAAAVRTWAAATGAGAATCVLALEPYVEPDRESVQRAPWGEEASAEKAEREREVKREAERQSAAQIIERARDPSARSLDDDLASLEELPGADRIRDYLDVYLESVTVAQRNGFLEALANVSSEHPAVRFHSDDLLNTIVRAADQWGGAGTLRADLAAALGRVLKTHFVSLTRYHEPGASTLSRVLEIQLFDDPAEPLIEALLGNAERLAPSALYGLATNLAGTLADAQRACLLDWSLDQLDVPATSISDVPETREETLAGVIWCLLGAPDKAIRWRAAHTARQLLVRGDLVLARTLWDHVLTTNAHPFLPAETGFLWMSARLWALLLFARVAKDAPVVVAPLLPEITAVAVDESYPHAAVREFAKRAALEIDASGSNSLVADVRENLLFVNRPRASVRERQHTFGNTDRRNRNWDNERFHFGSMDTMPYIYGPFGARFGLNVDKICARAEVWILDRLGLTDHDRRDPHLDRYDHNLSYATHGALPRVESWHAMLETHALQLVAGELCDESVPIIYEPYDDQQDPWEDWLETYLDSPPGSWFVDLRDPTPPRKELLLHDITHSDWPRVEDDDLDDFVYRFAPGVLIGDAYVSFSSNFGYGYTSVGSALIAADHAHAFMRMLQTADEPRAYRPLPVQSEHWERDEEEISDGGFQLLAWLWEERDPGERNLEEYDPLARLDRTLVRPSSAFIAHCRGTLRRDGRDLVDSNGALVATQISWSDTAPLGNGRETSDGTSGHLTTVRSDSLQSFLASQDLWLVLTALASRTTTRRHTMKDEDDEQKIYRVYLFKPDGSVTTLGGPLQTR
jgi:NACHT domain